MHQCLRIHEILSLVILEVAGTPGDEPQDNPGLASLAAMARTCRTFHDPAMDRLWLYLYNIDHLLALLPELSDGDAATSREQLELLAPRFRDIAARVKYLALSRSATERLLDKLDIIRRVCTDPTGLLLPNLSHLTIWFLAGSLREEQARSISGLLCGPVLQNLQYLGWSTGPRVPLAHLDLSMLRQLRAFSSSAPLPPTSLVRLAKLASLQTLSIVLPTPVTTDSLAEESSFLFLTELRLGHGIIHGDPYIARFLKKLPSHRLRKLSLDCHVDVWDMAELDSAIRATSTFADLRQLELNLRSDEVAERCDLRPLQSLHRLRELKLILTNIECTIADRDIAALGAAWPALSAFTLQHRSMAGVVFSGDRLAAWRPNRLTLAALAGFAEHFPRLASLSVDVDVRAPVVLVADAPSAAGPHIHMLELFSGVAGSGDPAAMVAYVSTVCPGAWLNKDVLHMDGLTPRAQAAQAWWEDVREMVNKSARPDWAPA